MLYADTGAKLSGQISQCKSQVRSRPGVLRLSGHGRKFYTGWQLIDGQ
jgi:hypothetical protein